MNSELIHKRDELKPKLQFNLSQIGFALNSNFITSFVKNIFKL